jgi:hypothetical protein
MRWIVSNATPRDGDECWTPHLAINRVPITRVSELRKDREFSWVGFRCCRGVRDLYARHAVANEYVWTRWASASVAARTH